MFLRIVNRKTVTETVEDLRNVSLVAHPDVTPDGLTKLQVCSAYDFNQSYDILIRPAVWAGLLDCLSSGFAMEGFGKPCSKLIDIYSQKEPK